MATFGMRTLAAAALLAVCCVPSYGGESAVAREIISSTVEQVRAVVQEKQGKTPAEDLEKELRDIIAPVFDFREMSMRCLGANWKKATPNEQTEFVDLFSDLLADNYLKKIRENVAQSNFKVLGDTMRGNKAVVQTTVQVNSDIVKIDYRMRLKNGSWQVYDVVIENIGLVGNYRSEFAGIIKKERMAGLLVRLRDKSKKKES